MQVVRKNILNVTAYIAGKPIDETQRELGLKKVYKLASNENALGTSPKALKAMQAVLKNTNRYPDSQNFYLKRRLAEKFGLKPENFVLGNGSDELIDIIIKTFVDDDDYILTAGTTFVEYKILSGVNNKRVIEVPLSGFKYDLKAMAKKVTSRTKLVFIANPNNPTGTYVNRKDLLSFINGLPESTVLVLDEAYDTFIDVKDFPDSLELVKNKNVLVLKTMSKAYGLAGLRIGYAIGNAKFTAFMERARQPFNVNLVAQAGALAALDDNAFLNRTKKMNIEGKKYLYSELDKIGIKYVNSVANFILIDTQKDCLQVFKDMLKLGVIVRDMKQYNLDSFIRVTIGTPLENRKFIQAFKKVIFVKKS